MDSTNGPTLAKREVAATLERVRTLQRLLDALATKVDAFDRRLSNMKERLEEIAKIVAE